MNHLCNKAAILTFFPIESHRHVYAAFIVLNLRPIRRMIEWRRAYLSAIAIGRSPHPVRAVNGNFAHRCPASSLGGTCSLTRTAQVRGGPQIGGRTISIPLSPTALAHLQASFIAIVLPRVLSHGRVCFRGVKCPHRREDVIQAMIGFAWQCRLRWAEKGKDVTHFPTALASYAARAVNSGSRVTAQERANDVLSTIAQRRHHFFVGSLPDFDPLADHPLCEALLDNKKSPHDKTACFKLDFTAWLTSLTDSDRRIAEDVMMGERTRDVADKHHVSPARISQKRREFQRDWRAFRGELPADSASSSTIRVA